MRQGYARAAIPGGQQIVVPGTSIGANYQGQDAVRNLGLGVGFQQGPVVQNGLPRSIGQVGYATDEAIQGVAGQGLYPTQAALPAHDGLTQRFENQGGISGHGAFANRGGGLTQANFNQQASLQGGFTFLGQPDQIVQTGQEIVGQGANQLTSSKSAQGYTGPGLTFGNKPGGIDASIATNTYNGPSVTFGNKDGTNSQVEFSQYRGQNLIPATQETFHALKGRSSYGTGRAVSAYDRVKGAPDEGYMKMYHLFGPVNMAKDQIVERYGYGGLSLTTPAAGSQKKTFIVFPTAAESREIQPQTSYGGQQDRGFGRYGNRNAEEFGQQSFNQGSQSGSTLVQPGRQTENSGRTFNYSGGRIGTSGRSGTVTSGIDIKSDADPRYFGSQSSRIFSQLPKAGGNGITLKATVGNQAESNVNLNYGNGGYAEKGIPVYTGSSVGANSGDDARLGIVFGNAEQQERVIPGFVEPGRRTKLSTDFPTEGPTEQTTPAPTRNFQFFNPFSTTPKPHSRTATNIQDIINRRRGQGGTRTETESQTVSVGLEPKIPDADGGQRTIIIKGVQKPPNIYTNYGREPPIPDSGLVIGGDAEFKEESDPEGKQTVIGMRFKIYSS